MNIHVRVASLTKVISLPQANAVTPFACMMTCVVTSGCCTPPCDLHTCTRTFCVAFQLILYNHATTNLLQSWYRKSTQSLVNMIKLYSKIHGGSEQMLQIQTLLKVACYHANKWWIICTIGICGLVSINTLDWYLSTPWLTLNRHLIDISVESPLIFDPCTSWSTLSRL